MNSSVQAAEENLVAATLVDNACFDEAALKYMQFYDARMQVTWKAIGKLIQAGRTADEISAADEAGVNPTELTRLTTQLGSRIDIVGWAEIIRNAHTERSVATIASDYAKWSQAGMSGADMLDKVRAKLEELEASHERKFETLAAVAASECKIIRETPPDELRGLPTGLGIERVVPGGIPRGKVTTLFSESGNFKTTTKNNIVLAIASAGYSVLDVSLEDADELTAHRFIAGCTGINYGRISAYDLTETERNQLVLPARAIKAAENVILAGEIPPNIDEIIRTARYYKSRCDLAAVVIDYVQLLESRNYRLSEREVLNDIMRKCQLAAKRDNMAYIVVSQVKQDVDTRTNHEPRITDMLGSSAMRTASKLAIGLYKPSLYHKVPQNDAYRKLVANHPDGQKVYESILELHFLKNVLGEPKTVIHCSVHPGTGNITPFSMDSYL